MPELLCIGMGYTAGCLVEQARKKGWAVQSAGRTNADTVYHTGQMTDALQQAIQGASHILISIPPDEQGCPVWRDIAPLLTKPVWLGYLSSTAVYGDHQGAWVDEESKCQPQEQAALARYRAEQQWLSLPAPHALFCFRLAGIYGPGRNALEQARSGKARRIHAPGKPFSRIHVEDIATAIMAAMERPQAAGLYNLADDMPAEASDVMTYAHALLGTEPPPLVPLDEAELSPMGRSFYMGAKRVANQKMKKGLGVTLKYPDYRKGLRALHESGMRIA